MLTPFIYSGSFLGSLYFPLQTQRICFETVHPMLPAPFRSVVYSPRPYPHPTLCSPTGKQQLALDPCGLIKLLQLLLSMSLIRSWAWTSGSSPVYSYSVEEPVVRAGSRGVDMWGGGWRHPSLRVAETVVFCRNQTLLNWICHFVRQMASALLCRRTNEQSL